MTKTLRKELYGVETDQELTNVIEKVSESLAMGANVHHLRALLTETAIAESAFGKAPYDPNRGYGYGVWQFDQKTFAWTYEEKLLKNEKRLAAFARAFSDALFLKRKYGDLKKDALFACAMARLFWLTLPYPVGITPQARAAQWKKFYNTEAGKGSVAGYLKAVQNSGSLKTGEPKPRLAKLSSRHKPEKRDV